jgi:hypothetical protein
VVVAPVDIQQPVVLVVMMEPRVLVVLVEVVEVAVLEPDN